MDRKVLLSVVSVIALIIFSLITWDVYGGTGVWVSLDGAINTLSNAVHQPPLTACASLFSLLFSAPGVILLTIIISIILFFKDSHRDAAFFGSMMLLQAVLVLGIKELLHRARPDNALLAESTFAFPSGHTVGTTVFCGLLLYLSWDRLKTRQHRITAVATATLLALMVGLSRIYLNVHWFSDVLAGFALGAFIVGAAALGNRYLQLRAQKRM